MPIDKDPPSTLKNMGVSYTVLRNDVSAMIENPDAFCVWAYLMSKPDGWVVRPTDVRKRYKVNGKPLSRERYRAAMADLRAIGLISYSGSRGEGGKLVGRVIHVHDHPTECTESRILAATECTENRTYGKPNVRYSVPLVITEREVKTEREVMTENQAVAIAPAPTKVGEVAKARKQTFDPKTMTTPDTLNADAWNEWIDYRVDKRKPVTQVSAKKQVAMLAGYSFETQQQMVDASIANGWQGLFPPKVNGNQLSAAAKTQRDIDLMQGSRLLAEAAMRRALKRKNG